MALAELQAATARLSVDATARKALRENPAAFAQEAGLDDSELQALQEKAAEFERFARALLNKRTNEAGKAMSQTRAALGESYRVAFAKFAEAVAVPRDPALDAIAFLQWLRNNNESRTEVRDLARYELAALRFRRGNASLSAGIFRCRAGRFFAIWWRTIGGNEIHHFQWPKAFGKQSN